jgi:hypothetical protein
MTETTEIERTSQAQAVAISSLLSEFDLLSDRQRKRLHRRYPDLTGALQHLATSTRLHHDAVLDEANRRIAEAQELQDNLQCLALILEQGPMGTEEWEWVHFPEVTHFQVKEGVYHFLRWMVESENNLIVRTLPMTHVHEVRNVPIDHPMVAAAIEWTVANQGQPAWRADDGTVPDEDIIGPIDATNSVG